MHRQKRVESASGATALVTLPPSGQYIGRIYSSAPGLNFFSPSFARSSIASTVIVGLRHMVLAERLRRAKCLSRSGVTPSKARAPSNTLDPNQKAWVRAPTNGRLPSSHSPSRKVKVCDQADMIFELARLADKATRRHCFALRNDDSAQSKWL